MSKKMEVPIFLISFLVICLIHYFFFELRYAWHNKPDDYFFLRHGYAIFLTSILFVAAFYPSKILVVLIVPSSLLFPPFLRNHVFVEPNLAMLIVIAVITMLFLLLMIWRQKLSFWKSSN